jgi:hypothetical protein
MTTARPASSRRSRTRANGDGTIYQRKDGRWEAAGYVLAPGNTRKRVRVYGVTRKDALAKLTEKIAASNRGVPVAAADSTVSTYWLDGVAIHHLRENTYTRYAAAIRLHLSPGLGAKKLARLTTRDVRTFLDGLRVTCQCCAQERDMKRRRCFAIGQCCEKRLSPLTVTYVHAVLKSALEHAVREEELPRNVARNVKTTTPRPRRSGPSRRPRHGNCFKRPTATGCMPCTNSPCAPASARANSSASAGKTSTSMAAPPPSTAPSSAPAARA